MPRYDYICSEGHTTERVVALRAAPGPKTIKCNTPTGNGRATTNGQKCGRAAKRVEVYTPAVSGTPTRGAF